MKTCPNCKAMHYNEVLFCKECGHSLPESRDTQKVVLRIHKCEYCGTKNEAAYKGECPSCPKGAMGYKEKEKWLQKIIAELGDNFRDLEIQISHNKTCYKIGKGNWRGKAHK